MSSKKNQSDLNISGLSPLVLNLLSPQSAKNSPAKNAAVLEAINENAKKLIAGYDKWKLCENKGVNSLNEIHKLRETSRKSNEPKSFTGFEVHCEQLKAIESMLESIVKEVAIIQSQIDTSLSIQRTMSTSNEDPLLQQLITIQKFLNRLKELYDKDLSIKKTVIQSISHTSSSVESHVLITSWYCQLESNEISRLIVQLKISPADCRWDL
ncbi:uncharacterized protein [Chironomus tepperi]|uniref:uncharacterized protein n=1 Tax=Chironomus tepperi TaxID=113505 RepID=UPI00391F2AED